MELVSVTLVLITASGGYLLGRNICASMSLFSIMGVVERGNIDILFHIKAIFERPLKILCASCAAILKNSLDLANNIHCNGLVCILFT